MASLMPLLVWLIFFVFFFFQAEDGIRDGTVTGVQTCALPIFRFHDEGERRLDHAVGDCRDDDIAPHDRDLFVQGRGFGLLAGGEAERQRRGRGAARVSFHVGRSVRTSRSISPSRRWICRRAWAAMSGPCVTKTIPSSMFRMCARSSSDKSLTFCPLSQYSPAVGVSRQPIRFISVDFPDPDGPMIATNSLRRIWKSTPRRACTTSPPMS